MVTAISQGSRVEDLSARTPSSATYANPDGTWTLESYSGLVRAKDDDEKWVGVDPSLEDSKNGLAPAAVPFDVEYGDGGSKDLATVTSPSGSTLSIDWPTKLPTAGVDGDKVTFEPPSLADPSAGDGDLVVTSFAEGFNFSVVLDKAPGDDQAADGDGGAAAGPEYRFPLSLSQGRFVTKADGSIDIKSGGKLIGSITPPVMWDSADEPKAVPVDAVLEGDAADADRVLVLRPDPAYLADPERVYPVTVDPTVTLTATGDTWVQNLLPNTSQHTSPELRVGTNNLGVNQNRSYLNFDTTGLGSPQPGWIVDAKVSLSNFTAGSCSGSDIKMSQITSAWTVPGITWSNKPTVTSVGAKTNDTAHGFTGCTSEDTVDFDATDIVKSWAGGATNHGVELAAVTLNNASYRKYRSLENGDNTKSPKLTVTISQPPATPTSLVATPGLYNNFITSKTPTLSAVVTDPDGGQVKGYFEIKQGSTLVWSGTSPAVPSGGTATIDVPAGELTEATTYTISAWAEDDVDVRSTTPATKTVTVDTIAPTATITSAQFTNGTWTSTVPGSDSVTIDGSSDTGGFYLNYDGVTNAVGANSSGDRVQTYTPTPGWHVFEVTPVDKAGNLGTPVTFTYGTGAGAFTTPTQWTPSTASFPVDFSGPPAATDATLQWRLAGETTWRTATKVKKTDGTNWTGTVIGSGRSTTGALVWNATEEDHGTGKLKGTALLETRGCFQYSGSADSCTSNLYLSLYASAFGDRFPTTELGPAQVALLNGEAMISETDAADSKAGIGRTFSSLSDATLVGDSNGGVFGPAWSDPQILAPQTAASASVVDNRSVDGTIVIIDADGGSQVFKPTGGGVFKPTQPTGDATSLTLTLGTPNTLELSQPLGTALSITTWEWRTSDTGNEPNWVLKRTDSPGTEDDIAVTSTGQRPTFISESAPGSATVCNTTTQTDGCRALKISYTGTGTATRVSKVERIIGGTSPAVKTIASYTYSSGELTKVCGPAPSSADPPLCTEYTYTEVSGRTMLGSLKPPGLTAWRLGYDSIGRLQHIKRERPASNGGGDAIWSIDYNLALTSAGLPDMSATQVAEWGQQAPPTRVYAIYGPHTGSADIAKASLTYTTTEGVTTNTAVQGPAGWLVDTSWYDERGNVIQRLDATGWARAQAAEAADRPQTAAGGSSYYVYNTWGGAEKAGTRVVEEYGPARSATLANGTLGYYRPHTTYTYDDDPEVSTELVSDRPTGTQGGVVVLRTRSTASADRSGDFDHQVTRYGFGPIAEGDVSGWSQGSATSTSVKVDANTWSTEATRFDADGDPIETRLAGGAADSTGVGSDARSTTNTYYTATGTGNCGGQPAWEGLLCKRGPAAQPGGTTIPTSYVAAYNADLKPTQVEQVSGGAVVSSTSNTYDDLGRVAVSVQTSTGPGVDADSITTSYEYDAGNGLLSDIVVGNKSLVTHHDAWGRIVSYKDAHGTITTTTYDAAGRTKAVTTGTDTTTYHYNDLGILTSVDTPAGTFAYKYNAVGALIEVTYPNEVEGLISLNEVGTPTGVSYSASGDLALAFTTASDASGRQVTRTSAASAQDFEFDALGRLHQTEDHRASGCVTRRYQHDQTSNRTATTHFAPTGDGGCQTTDGTIRASTFDAASRLSGTGYAYDKLGRTTSIPATDTAAGSGGPLNISYRANNMIDTLEQSTAPSTATQQAVYSLDPAGRFDLIVHKTNGTETRRLRYRYASGEDTPERVEQSTDQGATWVSTDYVRSATGLVAERTGGDWTYHVPNPGSDLVATTDATGAITAYAETDEFGNELDLPQGTRRYGWHGGDQRASDNLGGTVAMGARLYNPVTGSFTSTDPVAGGTATPYSYPDDPVNFADLSGTMTYSRRPGFSPYCSFEAYRPAVVKWPAGYGKNGNQTWAYSVEFSAKTNCMWAMPLEVCVQGQERVGGRWSVLTYTGFNRYWDCKDSGSRYELYNETRDRCLYGYGKKYYRTRGRGATWINGVRSRYVYEFSRPVLLSCYT